MTEALSAADFAARYDLDPELVKRAYDNLASGRAILLGVSGKLGAGKDTVAPLLVSGLGYDDAIHEFFAKPLKDEVTEAMLYISRSETHEQGANKIHLHQNVPYAKALLITQRLWADVKDSGIMSSYTRTTDTRFALQHWGTEIRRSQDLNYWVKKAIGSAVAKIAEGVTAYVTDARFENEIDAIHDLGGYTVRLKVSREVQHQRIVARDGIAPTDEALNHSSEIALDEYEAQGRFRVIVDTDELDLDGVVKEAVAGIRA